MTTAPQVEDGALTLDGKRVAVRPGDTIAAALLRQGIVALRHSRTGEARGVFCGIGICNECLVTVNGRPNVRACVTPAEAGAVVATGRASP